MDQIFKKNILILIGIAILIVAIPVSITVVQQSQDLRSKAADETVLTCKGVKPWTEIDNELRVAGYDGAFDHSSTELAAFNRTACPAGGSSGTTSSSTCTPNAFDANKCARCASDGSFWGTNGSDFGPTTGSTQWCSCAQKYASDYSTSGTYATCRGGTGNTGTPPVGGTGNADDNATCAFRFLEPTSRKGAPYLISGNDYILEVTSKNNGQSSWKADTYKLAFERNKDEWGGSDQVVDRDVAPGAEKIFDIRVKAPTTTNNEHRRAEFYIRMQGNGVGFGAACEPQALDITPKPIPPTATACYVISEDSTEVDNVKDCTSPLAKLYPQHPANINFTFKNNTAGEKTIYVKFFDAEGNPSNSGVPFTKKVFLSPNPDIDGGGVDCSYLTSGVGTEIRIRGTNFAAVRGDGKVRVGNQDAQISSWTTTAITARVDQRLEGTSSIRVIADDGRFADSSCTIGTTTFSMLVKNLCLEAGKFSASDVDIKVFGTGVDPLVRELTKVDKDGKPQGFAPKLEKNKNYQVIVKAPGTLAKRVPFNTALSTTQLSPIVLIPGDIYPRSGGDGKVNNFDTSELKRQWRLATDSESSGDLNQDGRVNSVDYSCIIQPGVLNKEDDIFIAPIVTNPAPIGVGSTQPSGVGSTGP